MKKTALITGASSGFGRSIAQFFGREGWRLVLVARRQEKLDELVQSLPDAEVYSCCLDVRDQEKVLALPELLPEPFQKIDLLVNNAGLALGLESAQAADIEDWNTMVDTNIKGLMSMTRAFLPQMVERDYGHVINIGSTAGSWPYPGAHVYGASKAFVKQFSSNLRADLLGTAVRVTNVEPGMAETEFSSIRFKGDQEKADKVYEGTQALQADDIGRIVHWVATQPPHVNINRIEVMCVQQAWGPLAVDRK